MVFRFRGKGDLRITEVGVVGSVDPEVFARVIAETDHGQNVEARLTQAVADSAAAAAAAPTAAQADALSAADTPSTDNPFMTRSAAYDQQPFIDVRRFGVVGNGTDETARILDAIAACPVRGGLLFPPPPVAYTFGGELRISKEMTLRGVHGRVPLRQLDPKSTTFRIGTNSPLGVVRLEGFELIGGTHGAWITGAGMYQSSTVSDFSVLGHSGVGLKIDAAVIGCHFRNLDFQGGTRGVEIIGDQVANACSWQRIRMSYTADAGFYCDNASAAGVPSCMTMQNITDAVFEMNGGRALTAKNAFLSLNGNTYFESNGYANGDPDIVLDTSWDGHSGFGSSVIARGCWQQTMSPAQVARGSVRIRFDNQLCQLHWEDSRWDGGVIDAQHFTVASQIYMSGVYPIPVINYDGGAFFQGKPGTLSLSSIGQAEYGSINFLKPTGKLTPAAPNTPTGYLPITIDGVRKLLPYYNP